MKKFVWLLIIPSMAVYAMAWNIRTGLRFEPGLIYNWKADPGYNGSSAFLVLSHNYKKAIFEAGIETGYDFSGFNLLIPVDAGFRVLRWKKLDVYSTISFLPGIKLNRPRPYFLFAVETNCLTTVIVRRHFSLGGSIGPRYTCSPGYIASVGPYQFLDISIGISANFNIGRSTINRTEK